MTVQRWDTSLIGVDPTEQPCSVLVIPGADAITDRQALDELRGWGWTVTVVEPDLDAAALRALAVRHDVALFCDILGTRVVRRALTATLPTVAIVPPRGHGRVLTLLREVGRHRDTTVLVVRDPRDIKILRKLSGSALVRSEAVPVAIGRAVALAAVLLRAHAWQPGGPAARQLARPAVA